MRSFTIRAICFLIILVSNGLAIERERRIIGGEVAGSCEFPFSVRLLALTRDIKIRDCGGALISLKHVATAAHCVQDVRRAVVHCGVTNINDPNAKKIIFSRTIIHPDYVPTMHNSPNDLAIGIMEKQIKTSFTIRPLALPTSAVDKLLVHNFSGWGMINSTTPSTILRKMKVHILPERACPLEPIEICGSSDNADFCDGDSGSPLVNSGTLTGIAVRSWCIVRRLHYYTNVFHFVDWINEKMNES